MPQPHGAQPVKVPNISFGSDEPGHYFRRLGQALDGYHARVFFLDPEIDPIGSCVEGNLRPCTEALLVEAADEDDGPAYYVPWSQIRQIAVS